MAPRTPLVTLELDPLSPSYSHAQDHPIETDVPKKYWYSYIPLCVTVVLIFAPHPSLLFVLVDFHLLTLNKPLTFLTHLFVTYTLTFLALSSLIVCVVRDPGPVISTTSRQDGANDEMDLSEALMPDIDFNAPGMWCRKCWAPKPERTHHCSICGRCVLRMDHHCPWVGATCLGHRTYPAFVHFLCCVTLLALYIAIISILALVYAFNNPFAVNEVTPVHELCLAFAGMVITFIIGSFFVYHLYLISTNQTTLENISPFLLLRHLPPLPTADHSLSDPPLEPELSYQQRRIVKDAHSSIRMYNVGWRRNWAQVFGWKHKYGWVHRLWLGGSSPGDGKTFPKNLASEDLLARLAQELVKADKDR